MLNSSFTFTSKSSMSSWMNFVSLTMTENTCLSVFSSSILEKSGYFSIILAMMSMSSILRICLSLV